MNIPATESIAIDQKKAAKPCQGKGYKGRTAVSELIVIENRLRELLVTRPSGDSSSPGDAEFWDLRTSPPAAQASTIAT